MQLSAIRTTIFALLFSCSAVWAANDAWPKFAPQTKDFDVQMPAPVDSQVKEASGMSIRFYKSTDGNRNFVISATTLASDPKSFDSFSDGIKDSIKDEKAEILSSNPKSGTGWTGSLVEAQKGEMKFCYLISHATDAPLGYTLVTNGPSSDPQTKEFLDSFAVHVPKSDPNDQTYGGLVDPKSATVDTPFEEGRRTGKIIGMALPLILVILVVMFIKKQQKAKKKD